MTMSMYDKQNIGHVMLNGTWFTAELLRLISKADLENRERIRLGFPEEVAAYEAWARGGK